MKLCVESMYNESFLYADISAINQYKFYLSNAPANKNLHLVCLSVNVSVSHTPIYKCKVNTLPSIRSQEQK